MDLTVIILCGGQGSRIRSVLGSTPKILAPIKDNVFLDYLIAWLQRSLANINYKFILATGIGHEQIKSHVLQQLYDCTLSREERPLGTYGALIHVVNTQKLNGDILVLNGDTIFEICFESAYQQYCFNRSAPLLVVKESESNQRYGGYTLSNGILRMSPKNPRYISMGAFFCNTSILDLEDEPFPCNGSLLMLDQHFLDKKSTQGYVLSSDVPFIDIGIPSDLSMSQTMIPNLLQL